jgi:hypothetical protein
MKLPMKSRLLPMLAVVFSFVPRANAHGDNTTWDVIQHQVLDTACVNCHTAGHSFATQSDLVLTEDAAYNELVGTLPKNNAARADGLVRVSNVGGFAGVQQSFLWEKINAPEQEHYYNDHPGYGALMPLGDLPLTNGQLSFVRKWIEAGAPQTGIVADPVLLNDASRYEPPEFRPLTPPPSGRGFQLHLGPYTAWAEVENDREFLYYQPMDTTQDQFVTRYELSYTPGSHHFIVYNYPDGNTPATPPANVYRELRTRTGQTNFLVAAQIGQLFPFYMFAGTQTPYTNYSLPRGVALRLPAGRGFDLNVHTVNRTGVDRTNDEVYANFYTVDRSEVQYIAESDYFGDQNITLPPNQMTTISKTFSFPEKRNVIQLWSHSHEKTVEFRIEGVTGAHAGELLYWTNDWEHPPLLQYDTPLVFEAGDQIKITTTWNNTTEETVHFGPLSTDEMQFMFYVYFPGTYTPPVLDGDANSDGVVNRHDAAIVASNFGRTTGAEWSDGDFDDDGRVDLRDWSILQSNLAEHANAPVPEPGTWLLAAITVAVGLVVQRATRRKATWNA